MAYLPGATSSNSVLPDWSNERVYLLKNGSGANGLWRQFEVEPPGDQLLEASASTLAIVQVEGATSCAEQLAPGGQLLFGSDIGNSSQLGLVQSSDLTLLGTFGAKSGSLSPSGSARILNPHSMAPMTAGGQDYLVIGSVFGSEICVMTVPGLVNTRLGVLDENDMGLGRGPSGKVYALGKQNPANFPTTDACGLYSISASAITKLGTISPSQVDATWTHFSNAVGTAWDQVDDNPIVMFQTTDVVVNTRYVVKLSAVDASVLWTCPVNAIANLGDYNMSRYEIGQQVMYHLGSGGRLYTIDTSDGSSTNEVISAINVAGGQVSEDITGSVLLQGSWSESSTHPNYVGTWMGTLGNHSIASGWMRFWPGGWPPQPPLVAADRRWLAAIGPTRTEI